MSWTTKLLVIANRTVESTEIRDAILSRAAAGPVEVTLVAPASSGAGSVRTCRMETARRLDRAVEQLREAGVPVEGVVGDTDPIVAVQDAWDPRRFDEVLVVTLPTGVSRWMTTDLPHRVQRLTAARVTHVVTAAQPVVSAPPSPAPSARRSPDAAVALAAGGSLRRTPGSLVRRPRRSRGGGRARSILR
jgi:GABA permease